MYLIKRLFDARDVADAEGDGDAIEAAVGIHQPLGVALLEHDNAVEPTRRSTFTAHLQHVRVDVADGDASSMTGRVDNPKGNIAGTAGEIEHVEIKSEERRVGKSRQ